MKIFDDGIAFVRKRPQIFLQNNVFVPEDMSGRLVSQAFMLGAKRVEVFAHEPWWGIASDVNWLSDNSHFSSPSEPFKQVRSDERLGQSNCFGEVILSAFCSSVLAYSQGNLIFKIGEEHKTPTELEEWNNKNLCILFRYV